MVLAEWSRRVRGPARLWDIGKTLADARRTGRAAEVATLRHGLVDEPDLDHWQDQALLEDLYVEALALGDADASNTLAPKVRDRTFVDALHDGTLDQALAAAKGPLEQARVWVRHVAQGANPAFEAKLAAAVCPPTPPQVPAAGGVPPTADVRIDVHAKPGKSTADCSNQDVTVTLLDAAGKRVDRP